jgi:hypothetical protein
MPDPNIWPDWVLDPIYYEDSLQNLARYANPLQLRGLGLGLGTLDDNNSDRSNPLVQVRQLVERLTQRELGYTVEPFNPRSAVGLGGQTIRTTAELLEGMGTCLDFAISLAAMCVQARIPVVLAIAIQEDQPKAHAFIIVQTGVAEEDFPAGSSEYETFTDLDFGVWADAFKRAGATDHLIDPTPLARDDLALMQDGRRPKENTANLAAQESRTIRWLDRNRGKGRILAVAVQDALSGLAATSGGEDFYQLPNLERDLGITAWLPDLPSDTREFPNLANVLSKLPAHGNVLLIGPKGWGKSTLALQHAQQVSGSRGWFLDGSDRATLLRSLASAEAQCRGMLTENDQREHLMTLAASARNRLSKSNRAWTVVVDNADGRPGDLLDLLPSPGDTQSLIITTVNDDWRAAIDSTWSVPVLDPLRAEDLADEDRLLHLGDDELLPGLVRIARHCNTERLAATESEPSGVQRLVRAALGADVGPASLSTISDLAAALAAASFMPAEEITTAWLAGAAFGGDTDTARTAVTAAAEIGLMEQSRRPVAARDHDEMPIWMHRLVRSAVRELAQGPADIQAGMRVLALHRSQGRHQRYSSDELAEQVSFIEKIPVSARAHLFAQAATALMDLLEPQGSVGVKAAARLAELAQSHLDHAATDAVALLCTMLMARARPVNHQQDAGIDRVDEAIILCLQAENAAFGESRERRLLRGRAEAMRGILMKKKANQLGGHERRKLLEEVIVVLTSSYETRRAALLTDAANNTLGSDPGHHVDRGWFNLGGANIDLANAVRHESPGELPAIISRALEAYAGSLSLRRSEDTLYTAASLWGVGLALYTAALYCPGELNMKAVAPTTELDPVRRQQTRQSLLRAAEQTVTQSLDIRAEIDGPTRADTIKSRKLQLKISLAWAVPDTNPADRYRQLIRELRVFLKDIDLKVPWPDELLAGEAADGDVHEGPGG